MDKDLETRVMDRINSYYLIQRKSFELLDAQGRAPLTTIKEVIEIAEQFLRNRGVDTTQKDEVTGWDIYWARERAAAMTAIPNRGGMYQTYLPGRFLHYDLLAQTIASLFNGGEDSIKSKSVAEIGSGSGLGLMKLAERGANVTGLDSSIMAIDFANYLASHYNVQNRVTLFQGNYFNMPPEIVDKQFDVVYNSGVLEHERDAKGLIAQMARITKPGGYILISVPNEDSRFYKHFKQREEDIKRRFPHLITIPVEGKRYQHNTPQLMRENNLDFIRQDGLQIAPSAPVGKGDIPQYDLKLFDNYLPERNQKPKIEDAVNAWTVLEMQASRPFRIRHGWSTYYVGQKPNQPLTQ